MWSLRGENHNVRNGASIRRSFLEQGLMRHFCVIYLLTSIVSLVAQFSQRLTAADNKAAARRNVPDLISATERAGVLSLIEGSFKSNYGMIHTWEGTYRFIKKTRVNDGPSFVGSSGPPRRKLQPAWLESAGTLRFFVDQSTNSLFTSFEADGPSAVVDLETGQPVKSEKTNVRVGTLFQESILTPEHYLTFDPLSVHPDPPNFPPVPTKRIGRMAIRDARKEADQFRFSHVLDPRIIVYGTGTDVYGDMWDLNLEALLGHRSAKEQSLLNKNLSIREEETKNGARFVVTIKYDYSGRDTNPAPENAFTEVLIVDPAVRYNVTKTTMTGKRGTLYRTTKVDYRLISDVFIPSHFEETIKDETTTEDSAALELVLGTCTINVPIDAARFSVKEFKLNEGDRLWDKLENKLFVMHDGQFVNSATIKPVINVPGPSGSTVTPTGPRKMLLVLNTAFIVLLCGFALFRYRKQRQARRENAP
jgi:hypothetical protein